MRADAGDGVSPVMSCVEKYETKAINTFAAHPHCLSRKGTAEMLSTEGQKTLFAGRVHTPNRPEHFLRFCRNQITTSASSAILA